MSKTNRWRINEYLFSKNVIFVLADLNTALKEKFPTRDSEKNICNGTCLEVSCVAKGQTLKAPKEMGTSEEGTGKETHLVLKTKDLMTMKPNVIQINSQPQTCKNYHPVQWK